MKEKIEKLKTLVQEMSVLVDELNGCCTSGECNGSECVFTPPPAQQQEEPLEEEIPVVVPETPEQTEAPKPSQDFVPGWNYGYWLEAKTYDDVKSALVEAQRNRRPILIALSKPIGCTNCTNYWRHVTCDGVLGHDKNCDLVSKKHPIVEFAKEHKVVMLYLSPSKFPNLATRIMGTEYNKYLHKPTYYPVYTVVSVKPDVNLDKVLANDKILGVGNDTGDVLDFIMGYIGISGKPVLDCNGNQTSLKVKTDSTGWSVFKSNMEAVFADTSKTHGVVL